MLERRSLDCSGNKSFSEAYDIKQKQRRKKIKESQQFPCFPFDNEGNLVVSCEVEEAIWRGEVGNL